MDVPKDYDSVKIRLVRAAKEGNKSRRATWCLDGGLGLSLCALTVLCMHISQGQEQTNSMLEDVLSY